MPRRVGNGVDPKRLAMIVAVLALQPGARGLGQAERHRYAAGGVRIDEPGRDLAVALALASAAKGVPLRPSTASFGEVGLTGWLRPATPGPTAPSPRAKLGLSAVTGAEKHGCPRERVALLEAHTLRQAADVVGERLGLDERHVRAGVPCLSARSPRSDRAWRTPERAVRPGSRVEAVRSARLSPNEAVDGLQRHALRRGSERQRDCQVRPRLVDTHAARDVDETRPPARARARACRESTATIMASRFGSTPGSDAARHSEVGLGRRAPGSRAGAGGCLRARTRPPRPPRRRLCPKTADGSGTPCQPRTGHLEHAELVRRAESVLRRAQHAVCVVAVALELKHAVDEVLEHARAGDRTVLRDVPDEESAMPASFPTRRSRAAASRVCVTDPGAEPISAEYSVWIESITHTSGRSRSSVAQTASRFVSARISTSLRAAEPAARSFTWRSTPRR